MSERRPIVMMTYVEMPGRRVVAELCVKRIKEIFPHMYIMFYAAIPDGVPLPNFSDEFKNNVAYYHFFKNVGHYEGEMISWDMALIDMKKFDCNVLFKLCADCLVTKETFDGFLNPVMNNEADLMVSNRWIWGGHPGCANTQVFCGTMDALQATLPSIYRMPDIWNSNIAIEVNFRNHILGQMNNFRIKEFWEAIDTYQHSHEIRGFRL